MSDETHHIIAHETDVGQRLDKFLSARLPDFSRSRMQALIESGQVTMGERTIGDVSHKVKAGTTYSVTIPPVEHSHLVAQDIALDIIYEDADILVINKPPGLTVHPAPGHPDMTLVNALLAHCGESLSGIGGVARPGIVHRLDKDTSGLLVVAKHDKAHAHLSAQLSERTLRRTYHALVWGTPPKQGTISANIGRSPQNRQKMAVLKQGGREATTHFKTLAIYFDGAFSLVECRLETGRTHQIRVHLTHLGHPLVGDPVYGGSAKAKMTGKLYRNLPNAIKQTILAFNRQALHARALGLIHPIHLKAMHFECPIADDLQRLLVELERGSNAS
ncbi:MAG: RluA family pseudouridine synthase [Rickettsiales bacterium]|nr:RluA family pseudouridine synthase [Rickettsiales bacterium]